MHLNLLELDERKLYKSLYFFFVKVTLKILQCSDKYNSKNNYS